MAAAGLGLRKSGKFRVKSSNQGWSPNSGQDAELESASLDDVFASEQGQHSSSSSLRLPQQNQQADSQTQSASSVRGEKSSRVTKVPLAESRRLIVMESKLSECMERKDRKKMGKCRER